METETLKNLCKVMKVRINGEAKTPYEKQNTWQKDSNSFNLTLQYKGKSLTLDYWQGTGIYTPPTTHGVMECLLSDYSCAQDSFEDFCDNCGYSNDSLSALKVYKSCIRLSKKLVKFLGNNLNQFLNSER
jgi:hypothetical protein